MDIKRVAINAVTETIVMTVVHMDYKGQVAKRINEKMPLATVKGFRKGQVPKDLVEKQYGKKIKEEEVQKVVEEMSYRIEELEKKIAKMEEVAVVVPEEKEEELPMEMSSIAPLNGAPMATKPITNTRKTASPQSAFLKKLYN